MAFVLAQIHTWLTTAHPRRDDDRGSSLVEYALLLGLIAMVCIVALGFLGESVSSGVNSAGDGLSTAGG
jgi:Flp pilus assembly pilin Flp